jgi:hypothetical protein
MRIQSLEVGRSLTPPVLARLVQASLQDCARATHRLHSFSLLVRQNEGDTEAQVVVPVPGLAVVAER